MSIRRQVQARLKRRQLETATDPAGKGGAQLLDKGRVLAFPSSCHRLSL
jgi:hypothetical protein